MAAAQRSPRDLPRGCRSPLDVAFRSSGDHACKPAAAARRTARKAERLADVVAAPRACCPGCIVAHGMGWRARPGTGEKLADARARCGAEGLPLSRRRNLARASHALDDARVASSQPS